MLGNSLQWKTLKNDGNDHDQYHQKRTFVGQIKYASYAYINNNLVGIQLIEKSGFCFLKVNL